MSTPTDIPAPNVFPHVFVVQASAGAGKTYSLGLRFLQLLALARTPSPAALRRVMALTFTVAAAQEMKSRIISFLKDIALRTEHGQILHAQSGLDPDAAKAWLDCILVHFQKFQVKTIDSLHFQMVQALGRRMNLWPDLETSFDQSRWAKLMLDSLLARTDWDDAPSSSRPAAADSLRSLWEGIFEVYLHLEERAGVRFLNWLENQAVHVFSGLDQLLEPLRTTSIAALRARQKTFEDFCREFCLALENLDLDHQVSRFKPALLFADPLQSIDSAFFAKQQPEELFKKSAHAHPELPLAWKKYQGLCQARNAFLLERARLRVDPLARLQQLLMLETERLGRSQGLLLGGWWTRLIRQHLASGDLLLEAEMVLNAGWRHLLIDEFQDTSREQWEVLRELTLEALAQGGSLFCVGDVKQAIYGWRGGDWQLFFEPLTPQTFPNVEAHARLQAALPFNRRSCPEIVEFNNACFASLGDPDRASRMAATMISGKGKEHARALLTDAIARLYAQGWQKPWVDSVGAVLAVTLRTESSEEYRELAMHALLGEITTLRRAGEPLGNTAVLVRTNAEAGICAKALLGNGIPTVTEHSLLISGHPLVRGLLALLAWLDNPVDDAALYALCASPLLSRATIDAAALVRAQRNGPNMGNTAPALYHVLREEAPRMWSQHLQPFWEHAGFASAYEVILAAIRHFDLREMPLGQWAWVEKLLEACWSAEAEGAGSIAGFLEYWREKGRTCVVGLPEGLDAVRVLTMHKAKGLEFPRVILPLLDYGPKNRSTYQLLHTASGEAFLASTGNPRSAEVAAAADRELAKNMAEELNLLYVALTRARCRMHLFLADVANSRGSRASDWLRALMPGQPPGP
jgi:ATP-dependent helicase/nuclease subunit A